MSFSDYLRLARETGIGIYPEIKHGAAANEILADALAEANATMESLVVAALNEFGYTEASPDCYIQSFELTSLKLVREYGSNVNLVFLLGNEEKTTDEDIESYKTDYDVVGLGLDKDLIVKKAENGHVESVNIELIERVAKTNIEIIAPLLQ